MKFGRRLMNGGLKERHWDEFYLHYNSLKDRIHDASKAEERGKQMQLVGLLEAELLENTMRVDTFFRQTLAKLEASMAACVCGAKTAEELLDLPLDSSHRNIHGADESRDSDQLQDSNAVHRAQHGGDGSQNTAPARSDCENSEDNNTPTGDGTNCCCCSLEAHLNTLIQYSGSWDVTDPLVVGDFLLEEHIVEFVNLVEQAEALRRFRIVNITAWQKIVKKARRRLPLSLHTEQAIAATSPSIQAAHYDTRLRGLLMDLYSIGDALLVTSTAAYEYMAALRMQHSAQNSEHRTFQREMGLMHKEKENTKRIASLTDLKEKLKPSYVILAQTLVAVLTLVVSYSLSSQIYIDEAQTITVLDEKGYFVSASIDMSPASHVGTLGLTTVTFGLLFTVFVRHKMMKPLLHGRSMLLHRLSVYVAVISIFCGIGVSSFQHHLNTIAHNIFAAFFFLLGVFHVFLEVYLETIYELYPWKMRFLRQVIVFFTVVSVFGFLILLALAGDMGSSDPEAESRLFAAAVFELCAFHLFLAYFLTFVPNFNQLDMHLVITVLPSTTAAAAVKDPTMLCVDSRNESKAAATPDIALPRRHSASTARTEHKLGQSSQPGRAQESVGELEQEKTASSSGLRRRLRRQRRHRESRKATEALAEWSKETFSTPWLPASTRGFWDDALSGQYELPPVVAEFQDVLARMQAFIKAKRKQPASQSATAPPVVACDEEQEGEEEKKK